MGVAGLIIGIIGVVFAVLPYPPFSQIAGVLLGIGALSLGAMARKHARQHAQPTGTINAGIIVGLTAVALSAVIYGSCLCSYERVLGSEFEQQLGSPEFQRAMKRAREAYQKGNPGQNPHPPESALKKKNEPAPVKKPAGQAK